MTDLFFDPPIVILIALAVLGVALLFVSGRFAQKRIALVGAAVLLLAVGWLVVSEVVRTDTERALERTHAIVEATEDRDWQTFASLLDPKTGLPGKFANRDEFVAGAELTIDTIGLKTAGISSATVDDTEPGALLVDTTVYSTQSIDGGRPVKTAWRFRYVQTDAGLILERIESLPTSDAQGVDVNDFISRSPSVP